MIKIVKILFSFLAVFMCSWLVADTDFSKKRRQVVRILNSTGTTGSGFIINTDGNILTNAHVVGSALKGHKPSLMVLQYKNGMLAAYRAEICKEPSRDMDLAVLYVEDLKREVPLSFAARALKDNADGLVAMGFPALNDGSKDGAKFFDSLMMIVSDAERKNLSDLREQAEKIKAKKKPTKADMRKLNKIRCTCAHINANVKKRFIDSMREPVQLPSGVNAYAVASIQRGFTERIAKDFEWGMDNSGRAEVIMHSVPIKSGNSGGPLFNLDGEVVGVNTASKRLPNGGGVLSLSLGADDVFKYLDSVAIRYYKGDSVAYKVIASTSSKNQKRVSTQKDLSGKSENPPPVVGK